MPDLVITDHPVAVDSLDHILPRGTKDDNSVNPAFNDRLMAMYPSGLSVLDLGCSGGAFVRSLLDAGVYAVGIEGSDYSLKAGRAEWGPDGCPDNLATADITKPFLVIADRFTVITAWEVLEHIANHDLEQVFDNIDKHLAPNGIVIASISPVTDEVHITDDDGNVIEVFHYHQIVCNKEWWVTRLAELGWRYHPDLAEWFGGHWVRDETNAPGSFHLVLERA